MFLIPAAKKRSQSSALSERIMSCFTVISRLSSYRKLDIYSNPHKYWDNISHALNAWMSHFLIAIPATASPAAQPRVVFLCVLGRQAHFNKRWGLQEAQSSRPPATAAQTQAARRLLFLQSAFHPEQAEGL